MDTRLPDRELNELIPLADDYTGMVLTVDFSEGSSYKANMQFYASTGVYRIVRGPRRLRRLRGQAR